VYHLTRRRQAGNELCPYREAGGHTGFSTRISRWEKIDRIFGIKVMNNIKPLTTIENRIRMNLPEARGNSNFMPLRKVEKAPDGVCPSWGGSSVPCGSSLWSRVIINK
jgi:hypothetical protein